MDWSLVLTSQDIPTTIERIGEKQWVLLVSWDDHTRALQSIRQYRLENRGWHWRHEVLGNDLTLHWGGVLWCLALAVVYKLSSEDFPGLYSVWVLKSKAVMAGEWWRVFSAVMLHADLSHLFANIATGCILFGLAMGRFGAGWGLLASFLAGAAGNLLGLLVHDKPYEGLGASGMVMGALGMITVSGVVTLRAHTLAFRHWFRRILAGILLFVFLGLNPASDVAAHLGGFVAGIAFGTLFAFLPDRFLQNRIFGFIAWLLFAALAGLALALPLISK